MNKTIVRMQFGSHVYGTNVPTSDHDYKSVFVPDGYDILMQRPARHIQNNTKKDSTKRNTAEDVDEESFSVQQFVKLLMEGQTVALDMLFTPREWYTAESADWYKLQDVCKRHLLHSGTSAFVGYTKQQAAKYGLKGGRVEALRYALDFLEIADYSKLSEYEKDIRKHVEDYKRPSDGKESAIKIVDIKGPNGKSEPHLSVANRKVPFHASFKYAREIYQKILDNYGERALMAERNEGVDWKACMHAVRVSREAIELLSTGRLTFPRPEQALLLKVRNGELDIHEVETIIESGLVELEAIKPHSKLPAEPNRDVAEDIVREFHEGAVSDYLRKRYGGP